jgi:UDP-glucose 4-epimerase
VISLFVSSLRSEGIATIHGDGSQSRDFIYVGDVARAVIAALTIPDPGALAINVGSGQSVTIRALYSALSTRLGVADRPRMAGSRAGDVPHSRASTERMHELLCAEPLVTFGQGLDRILAGAAQT